MILLRLLEVFNKIKIFNPCLPAGQGYPVPIAIGITRISFEKAVIIL